MKKFIYIDDEDNMAIQPIINGLNQSGRIEVFRMPLTNSGSINEICHKLNEFEYDGIIIDYMLNGNGPYHIDCNSNTIAQYVRDLADNNKAPSRPIVLCSTAENLKSQYEKGYTSSDLYDYNFSKGFEIDYAKEAVVLVSLAEGYEKIAHTQNICEILGRDISNLDERPFESVGLGRICVQKCSDLILKDLFKYSGILISKEILCARLGISEKGAYEELLAQFASAKYIGVFQDLSDYYWTDKVEDVFLSIFKTNMASLDAEEKIEIYREKFPDVRLQLAPTDSHSYSKRLWTICQETKVAIDPMEGYRLKEKGILKPWQEPRYVSFSAISDGNVKEETVISADFERYLQKVEYLKNQENEA